MKEYEEMTSHTLFDRAKEKVNKYAIRICLLEYVL